MLVPDQKKEKNICYASHCGTKLFKLELSLLCIMCKVSRIKFMKKWICVLKLGLAGFIS